MRPKGSAELLEDRRRRALRLLGEGRTLNDVARLITCAASSVTRRRNAWRKRGKKALKVRFFPAAHRSFHGVNVKDLSFCCSRAPWRMVIRPIFGRRPRIAEVIERHFGVCYHRAHAGRLMQNLGWSHQKPERRALERNERSHRTLETAPLATGKKRRKAGRPSAFFLTNRGSS